MRPPSALETVLGCSPSLILPEGLSPFFFAHSLSQWPLCLCTLSLSRWPLCFCTLSPITKKFNARRKEEEEKEKKKKMAGGTKRKKPPDDGPGDDDGKTATMTYKKRRLQAVPKHLHSMIPPKMRPLVEVFDYASKAMRVIRAWGSVFVNYFFLRVANRLEEMPPVVDKLFIEHCFKAAVDVSRTKIVSLQPAWDDWNRAGCSPPSAVEYGGLSKQLRYVSDEYATAFNNYHIYGLQDHWLRLLPRIYVDLTKKRAQMAVRKLFEEFGVKVKETLANADDDGVTQATRSWVADVVASEKERMLHDRGLNTLEDRLRVHYSIGRELGLLDAWDPIQLRAPARGEPEDEDENFEEEPTADEAHDNENQGAAGPQPAGPQAVSTSIAPLCLGAKHPSICYDQAGVSGLLSFASIEGRFSDDVFNVMDLYFREYYRDRRGALRRKVKEDLSINDVFKLKDRSQWDDPTTFKCDEL